VADVTWKTSKVFTTPGAVVAIDKAKGKAVCWGSRVHGGVCPENVDWKVVDVHRVMQGFFAVNLEDMHVTCWSVACRSINWKRVQALYSTDEAGLVIDKERNGATCFGSDLYGGRCPEGINWQSAQIYSTDRSFYAIDKKANKCTSWGWISDICPDGIDWRTSEVYQTKRGFLAVDPLINKATCWGDHSEDLCPIGVPWRHFHKKVPPPAQGSPTFPSTTTTSTTPEPASAKQSRAPPQCLLYNGASGSFAVGNCSVPTSEQWIMEGGRLKTRVDNKCLDFDAESKRILLRDCNAKASPSQLWAVADERPLPKAFGTSASAAGAGTFLVQLSHLAHPVLVRPASL